MGDDGLGDWRIRSVTTLAKDVPAAYPGGPSHSAGTPVYVTLLTKDSTGTYTDFVAPSPAAFALSISADAARRGLSLHESLTFRKVSGPHGPSQSVTHERIPALYDYFECCMSAATFSFMAIEVYCNQIIADMVPNRFKLKRKKVLVEYDSDQIQREASTEEKLSQILPALLHLSTPKGKYVWQRFNVLKTVRNSTVHLKAADAYNRGKVDYETLFYQFLNYRIDQFPRIAVEVIGYFAEAGEPPRWFREGKERILAI